LKRGAESLDQVEAGRGDEDVPFGEDVHRIAAATEIAEAGVTPAYRVQAGARFFRGDLAYT
jgi:hypothetical protein